MAITLSNVPSLLMNQSLYPSAHPALLEWSLLFDYHLTNPNPAFHDSHFASIPLPRSSPPPLSFPQPLAHLGCFPSYLYKYPVINQ